MTSAPSAVKAATLLRATRECFDVADDGDASPGQRAGALADRVAVEQRLGGVLVPAVAGVDHRGVDPAGHLAGHAGRAVADDDGVDAHGLDGLDGVAAATRPSSPTRSTTEKVMVSAESRLAAVSKLSRVRVESSKKSETTVWPRSAGTFGMIALADLDEGVGERHDLVDPGRDVGPRSSMPRRCRPAPGRRTAPPAGTAGAVVVLTCASPRGRRRRRSRRPPRRVGSAGSCRRSRDGSAARGAPGRP